MIIGEDLRGLRYRSHTWTLALEFSKQPLGTDVPIERLYELLRKEPPRPGEHRRAQQFVGGTLSRLNRIMRHHAIVPGSVKRSYQLTRRG